MIELPAATENRLILAANAAGLTPLSFLGALLEEYLQDKHDIQQAELSLLESGEFSHDELKIKYSV